MTTPLWEATTEAILHEAHADGRSMLYEYEMYRILKQLGLRVPVYTVVRSVEEITPATMRLFSSRKIVIKAISRSLLHKSLSGGVSVVYKDTEFIKYSCITMNRRLELEGIAPEGFLLVEHVSYFQSLGNEILLGFRESRTFGMVISFSKGGDDADHFAKNFSAPNLIFPPIDRKWATALQQSTRIYSKYIDEHRSGFIKSIVDAEMKFSRLATRFSNYSSSPSRFAFTAFEVNPFVFTPENHFIALDGWASFSEKQPVTLRKERKPSSLNPFFSPKSVVVIGVSAKDTSKPANIILGNLVKSGHKKCFGVNGNGGSVTCGNREFILHKQLADINHPIDLAVICIPAKHTPAIVEQCAAVRVRAIILIPGGFSETTHDASSEQDIRRIAKKAGIRIIGPNCLGIITTGSTKKPLNTFFLSDKKFSLPEHPRSNVALFGQSGAWCVTQVDRLRHAVVPALIVSYGNQLDVDAVDLINYADTRDTIDVIGLYSEGLQADSGRAFFNAIARSGKTVIVYKAGKTKEGHRAIQSHTASIAGEYEVAKAAVKQAGGIVAETMDEHTRLIKTFSLLHKTEVRGRHVAVIANAGFETTCAADYLGNLTPATLSAETARKLEKLLPGFVSIDSLLDLTPMVSDEQYAEAISILSGASEVEALCISIVPQAEVITTTDEQIAGQTNHLASRMVKVLSPLKKPVVVSVNALAGKDTVFNHFVAHLEREGIPVFQTARHAMASLHEFIHFNLMKKEKILSEWLK